MNLASTIRIYAGGPGSGPRPGMGHKIRDFGRRAEDAVRYWQGQGHRNKMTQALTQLRHRTGMFEGPEMRKSERRRQWEAAGMAAATTHRAVNVPATYGPKIFEVHDRQGNILYRSKDQRGADIQKNRIDRQEMGLGKRPKALRTADALRDGRLIIQDERLRPTTAGGSRNG